MHSKKELEAVVKVSRIKTEDILNGGKGTDIDYIRELQTLAILKSAAEGKLEKDEGI